MKTETDPVARDNKSTVFQASEQQNKAKDVNKQSDPLIESHHEEKHPFESALCIQGNECIFICAEKKCQQHAIVCGVKKCPCREIHRKKNNIRCKLIEPQGIVNNLEKKIIKNLQIENELKKLEKLLDKVIDQISCAQEMFKYVGLDEDQRNFLNLVHKKKYQQIKGSLVYQINSNFYNTTPIQHSQLFQYKDIVAELNMVNELIFENMKYQIQSIFNVIDNRINYIRSIDFSIKSQQLEDKVYYSRFSTKQKKDKIIASRMMCQRVNCFFKKQIKLYRLIYRASQNDFLTEKFWDAYKKQPNTLFLITTEFDKVIGGFTPLVWETDQQNQTFCDPSKQSFIFSLTYQDKFNLVDSQGAITFNTKSTGPIFGGSDSMYSLKIQNKSNVSSSSIALYDYTYYQNSKYTARDKQSYQRFSGSSSYFFKIKEWEAFQVIFES